MKLALFITALVCTFTLVAQPDNGKKAIDFTLLDPKGKEVSLEDLEGKLILVDFWASWCGPCRKENPNVVEAYEKYRKRKFSNGKGFDIISISLDRDKKKWEAAIEKDGLVWKNHVIDEGGKVSKMYGVRSIPYSFLIDSDGNIVAQGNELRGLNLHITLDKFVKD